MGAECCKRETNTGLSLDTIDEKTCARYCRATQPTCITEARDDRAAGLPPSSYAQDHEHSFSLGRGNRRKKSSLRAPGRKVPLGRQPGRAARLQRRPLGGLNANAPAGHRGNQQLAVVCTYSEAEENPESEADYGTAQQDRDIKYGSKGYLPRVGSGLDRTIGSSRGTSRRSSSMQSTAT